MPGETINHKPEDDKKTEIILQRHDQVQQETEGDIIAGQLTPEGVEHAHERAAERAKDYLDADPDTYFLVVASNQAWDEEADTGHRALQTAGIISDEVKKALSERGISDDHLINTGFAPDQKPIANPVLKEANIFQNGFFTGDVKPQYESVPEAWQAYYKGLHEDERMQRGAESAEDLAQRMDYMMKSARVFESYFHNLPDMADKKLVVWYVGHGGGVDSYLVHKAGLPPEETGFGFSEGFTLSVDKDGHATTQVKGKDYEVDLGGEISLPEKWAGF